eukprot:scaffold24040_cov79-Skeletonema_dohrnii-CCMP3373.AAC.1
MMIATITSSNSLRCQISLLKSLLTIEVGHVFFWLVVVVVVIGGVIAVGICVGVGGRFDNVVQKINCWTCCMLPPPPLTEEEETTASSLLRRWIVS